MAGMFNNKLTLYLETNGLISEYQCIFRIKRNNMDNLERLDTFVRETFIKKGHLTTVFFFFFLLKTGVRYNVEIWYHESSAWTRSKRKADLIHMEFLEKTGSFKSVYEVRYRNCKIKIRASTRKTSFGGKRLLKK